MMRPTKQVRGQGKRIEISNVPLQREKFVKTDIPVEIIRREGNDGCQTKKTRTVRNVTLHVPPLPTVNKAYVCIDTDNETNLTVHKDIPEPRDIEIDKIIHRLQKGKNWAHPILLIITPSKMHKTQHKLHLIDRVTRKHLAMTTIKKKELLQLPSSKAFQKYSVVLTNRYLNLQKMAIETGIIQNLVNAANLECCRYKKCEHEECRQNAKKRKAKVKKLYQKCTKPDFSCSQTDSQIQSTSSATQYPVHQHRKSPTCLLIPKVNVNTREMSSNTTYRIPSTIPSQSFTRKEAEKLFDSWTAFRIMEPRQKISFTELVRRINDSPTSSHYFQDLKLFFDMIKYYNVKVYIRPELCPKAESCEDAYLRYRLPRFNVECFTIGLQYIGGITLDSQQLERQLLQHVDILPQVKVITDVCEITPLPRPIFAILRTLCELLCLELLYDALAEFIFRLYNRID